MNNILQYVNSALTANDAKDVYDKSNQSERTVTDFSDEIIALTLEDVQKKQPLRKQNVKIADEVINLVMRFGKNLKYIDISNIDFSESTPQKRNFKYLISHLPKLETLIAKNCKLGKEHAEIIATCNLKELNLYGNKLRIKGIKALAQSKTFTRLTKLDLGHNFIRCKGAIVVASSDVFSKLEELNLSLNSIAFPGTSAIANSNPLKNLKKLDLTDNPIDNPTIDKSENDSKGVYALISSKTLSKTLLILTVKSKNVVLIPTYVFGERKQVDLVNYAKENKV